MNRNSMYRLRVLIFTMAAGLMLPACRTITETEYYDASTPVSTRDMLCKLKRITIPEMTFYSPATIVDALDFIVKASKDYDQSETPLERHGVNYRLRLPSAPLQGDRTASDPFTASTNCAPPVLAAMSVRAISLYDALNLVCEATEMRWSIDGGVLEIEPDYPRDTELVTRSYTVPPALQTYLPENSSNQVPSANSEKPWKAFFEQLGVASPDLVEFTYLGAINKLRVTGTPKNLMILETVLDQFAERMVEVEMKIHAFRTADIERLRLSGDMSLESLMTLRREGKAKSVASSTVLTKSGQEAIMKAVREVNYPTEWVTDVAQTGSNVIVRSTAQALVPCNFSMRETGMILQVVPEVSNIDRSLINLTMKPQWITLDRWESYPADLTTSWFHMTRSFKQPVFGVTSFETQTFVKDGETLLLGSCSTPDGEWVQVGFLTTRLKPVQPSYARVQPAKAKPQGVPRDKELAKKLKEIFIPEIESPGRRFTIIDALRHFKEVGKEYDAPELSEALRGINFVVKLPMNFWDQTASSTNADPFAVSDPVTNNVPYILRISSHLYTLHDVLKLLCDVTGMKFYIRDGIVWIVPLREGEELTTRTYYPCFISYQPVNLKDAVRIDDELKGKHRDWKKSFEEMGVPWPPGSSISCLSVLGCLRVTNTPENLDIFEQVCKDLSLFPRMVEMDVQIHAFHAEDIEQVRLAGDVSVESLMDLRRKGKSKQVASATVVTKSGQEAIVKAVQEVIYPTELLTEVDQAGSSFTLTGTPQAFMPGNFTTRETGMTLQVVPEISSTDQSQINVTMKPQWVTLEGWKSYPADLASGWVRKKLSFKQPMFGVTSFETQNIVQEGGTVLLGSSSTPDGKWVHVGFLTVK